MLKPVIKYNFLHHNCNPIIIIIARCVRRAFLCGEDKVTGQSFEHRRTWVEDKLFELTKVFCIDVCAYAVMSNQQNIWSVLQQRKLARRA